MLSSRQRKTWIWAGIARTSWNVLRYHGTTTLENQPSARRPRALSTRGTACPASGPRFPIQTSDWLHQSPDRSHLVRFVIRGLSPIPAGRTDDRAAWRRPAAPPTMETGRGTADAGGGCGLA